jgi:hypothetical protein
MSRKPNGRGWSMGHDRELIALVELMPSPLIFNAHRSVS